MAKEKIATTSSVMDVLLQAGIYKKTQGRVARQVTFGALLVMVIWAAWQLTELGLLQSTSFVPLPQVVAIVFGLIGAWVSYRVVNIPRFADFLIAVEAEMNKVSWPTQSELVKSSVVVIFVIFFMTGALFLFDLVWTKLFQILNIM